MECAQSTATGRPRIGECKMRTILRILKYWTDNYKYWIDIAKTDGAKTLTNERI